MAIADNPHLDISEWKNVGLLVLDKMDGHDIKYDKLLELNESVLETVNKIELVQAKHSAKFNIYDIIFSIILIFTGVIVYKEFLHG
jgi:hypothetical protein